MNGEEKASSADATLRSIRDLSIRRISPISTNRMPQGRRCVKPASRTPPTTSPSTSGRRSTRSLGHTTSDKQGLLPFRVWQFFNAMVDALEAHSINEFVCAAGVMAHYVGDACQPLHGSVLANGFKDGSGEGVHSAYETTMIDNHAKDDEQGNPGCSDPSSRVSHKHCPSTCRVIRAGSRRRDRSTHGPSRERDRPCGADHSVHQCWWWAFQGLTKALFNQFGVATGKVMADGTVTLAMLWESAWRVAEAEGTFSASELGPVNKNSLRSLARRRTSFSLWNWRTSSPSCTEAFRRSVSEGHRAPSE